MKEIENSAEATLTKTVYAAAGALALGEIFLGVPRNPVVDLTAAVAILNVAGVPATPMLQAFKSRLDKILHRE